MQSLPEKWLSFFFVPGAGFAAELSLRRTLVRHHFGQQQAHQRVMDHIA